ncbi:winged helix-turn-helix domain-containing protein [Altererythrobacter sp. MF3-039]|uniref:winged helix-turn-helix domain-containing protein n=1 Tax=Altererythrobacter sp. MF3-039 TaxID=3252901 RepID=UPI00390C6C25
MDQSGKIEDQHEVGDVIGHVDLAHIDDFVLGPLSVAPSRRLISGTLADATLEPKVMVVLVALSRAGTRTLSKDDLIRQCWDGRIVGDASINRVISLLRTSLRDTTGEVVSIETIPKVGYRILIADDADGAAEAQPTTSAAPARRILGLNTRSAAIGIAILAVLAAVSLFAVSQFGTGQERVSIAMLSLEAHEGTDAFYATGIASELQSELARHPDLEVTVPESAKQLLAHESSVQDIGRLLKTDAILNGSIEAASDRTILHLELVSTETGKAIWRESVASSLDSSETLPTRVARKIAMALDLEASQGRVDAQVSDADYQLFLAARGMIASRQPDQLEGAADILAGVVERNSSFAGGWSARAKATALLGALVGDPSAERDAVQYAKTALELDANSVEALKISGFLAPDAESRVALLRRAIELDPGDAESWLWLGAATDHPEYLTDMPKAMTRVVELDPLWDRAWQASYYLRGIGDPEGADRIDQIIVTAAAEPWQADVAQARIALRRGEQSEFFRVMNAVMPVLSPRERQLLGLQLTNQGKLLDVLPADLPVTGMAAVINGAIVGKLPPQEDMDALGIDGDKFFATLPLVIGGSTSLVTDGRTAQLVGYYDEAFGSPEALERYAMSGVRAHHFIPQVATYVGVALREEGRKEESQALFALAEKSIALWNQAPPSMTAALLEANLAAAKGETARAIAAIGSAVGLGWPYNSQSPGVAAQGPISDDAIWDSLRSNPALVSVLAPVRANLAKERAEILAL